MRAVREALVAFACLAIACGMAWSAASKPAPSSRARSEVPVATTRIAASAIAAPTAVQGSDGKWYLVFEMSLLNVSPVALRVDRIDLLSGDGKPLASYAGARAVRTILSDAARMLVFEGIDLVPSSGGAMLWLDVPFDRRDDIPGTVMVRLATTEIDGNGAPKAPGADGVMTFAPIAIDPSRPTVISPPLAGGRWVNTNGCCAVSPHTRSLQTFNGARFLTQRYAIDWVKIDGKGAWWHTDAGVNANYYGYGETVYAATSGVVVEILNTLAENTPPMSGPFKFGEALGNHIILDIGNGRYLTYAHLQPGSILVRAGDRVRRGQAVAKLGNSGNSAAPHLHMHISDGYANATATSQGKPWALTEFELAGRLANEEAWLDQAKVVPAEIVPAKGPAVRRNALPLLEDVVVFPPPGKESTPKR